MLRSLVCMVILTACGSTANNTTTTETHTETHTEPATLEPGMPDAMSVCVRAEDGSLAPGEAVPSRAGQYDPNEPIIPQHLNWMVAGQGCVNYPGDARDQADCGGQHPVVTRVLCQQ